MRIFSRFIEWRRGASGRTVQIVASPNSPAPPSTLDEFAVSSDVNERAVWFRFAIDYFYAVSDQEPSRTDQIARQTIAALGHAGPIERLEVARQLSMALRAPSAIFDALEAMGGEAGAFVLRHCAGLSEERVAMASEDPERAGLVAARAALPAATIDLLIRQRRIEPLLILVANESIWFTPLNLAALGARAAEAHESAADPRLAAALLRGRHSGHSMPHFSLSRPRSRGFRFWRPPSAPNLATLSAPRSRTFRAAWSKIWNSWRCRQTKHGFVGALAKALGVALPLARRIVEEPSGDVLTLALAALQARDEAIVRILVSIDLNTVDPRRRVAAFARLKPVLSPRAAWRILNAIRGQVPAVKSVIASATRPGRAPTPSRSTLSSLIRGPHSAEPPGHTLVSGR